MSKSENRITIDQDGIGRGIDAGGVDASPRAALPQIVITAAEVKKTMQRAGLLER